MSCARTWYKTAMAAKAAHRVTVTDGELSTFAQSLERSAGRPAPATVYRRGHEPQLAPTLEGVWVEEDEPWRRGRREDGPSKSSAAMALQTACD